MTLAVKLLLIGALVLGIIIPFGYYLIGEKNKKRYKRAVGANAFFYFGAMTIAAIMMFGGSPVHAADAAASAGNATGLGCHVWAAASPWRARRARRLGRSARIRARLVSPLSSWALQKACACMGLSYPL